MAKELLHSLRAEKSVSVSFSVTAHESANKLYVTHAVLSFLLKIAVRL